MYGYPRLYMASYEARVRVGLEYAFESHRPGVDESSRIETPTTTLLDQPSLFPLFLTVLLSRGSLIKYSPIATLEPPLREHHRSPLPVPRTPKKNESSVNGNDTGSGAKLPFIWGVRT